MDQPVMTVDAFTFTFSTSIQRCSVSKHGSALRRHMQEVAMTLLTIRVLHVSIGCSAVFAAVIRIGTLQDVDDDIFYAVQRLIVKKIDRVFWWRQVAIHAVGDNALRIIHMTGCFPGLIGGDDFMATGAELWSGCPSHGIIKKAEQRKCYDHANKDKQ